jgi:hypothetical protein
VDWQQLEPQIVFDQLVAEIKTILIIVVLFRLILLIVEPLVPLCGLAWVFDIMVLNTNHFSPVITAYTHFS